MSEPIWSDSIVFLTGGTSHFLNVMENLLPIVKAADATRPALKGVFIDLARTNPVFVATDTYRFLTWGYNYNIRAGVEYKVGFSGSYLPKVIFSYDTDTFSLLHIVKELKKYRYFSFYEAHDVEWHSEQKESWYKVNQLKIDVYGGANPYPSAKDGDYLGTMLTSNSLFPHWSNCIETGVNIDHITQVDSVDLKGALDKLCSKKRYNTKNGNDSVIINCNGNELNINRHCDNITQGDSSVTIPCTCMDTWRKKFNLFYLRDFCNVGGVMRLLQGYTHSTPSPMSIKYENDPLWYGTLMPMMLDE